MIFVTVGTQLPFDRLVRTVDEWALTNKGQNVYAQIGNSALQPASIEWVAYLSPDETARCIRLASAVVSHAGIGSIIAALQHRKPIIVLPRRAALGEHRSEHQVATARRFGELGLVHVANDESALGCMLDSLSAITVSTQVEREASTQLTEFLSDFLQES